MTKRKGLSVLSARKSSGANFWWMNICAPTQAKDHSHVKPAPRHSTENNNLHSTCWFTELILRLNVTYVDHGEFLHNILKAI